MDEKLGAEEVEDRPAIKLLRSWLNKNIKVVMSDGRCLIGNFLCTDRTGNVIIGSCNEYTCDPDSQHHSEEPRMLGLAMVPGPHIVKLFVDESPCAARANPSPVNYDSDEL